MAEDPTPGKPFRVLNDLLKTMVRDIDQAQYAQSAQNEFERLFYNHDGRPAHKWHHYLEVYDKYLGSFLARRRRLKGTAPIRLLEIGVGGGGPLQLWRKFLGHDSIVFGVEIDQKRRGRWRIPAGRCGRNGRSGYRYR